MVYWRQSLYLYTNSLPPETNSLAPEKTAFSKRKQSSSNHPFFRGELFVLGSLALLLRCLEKATKKHMIRNGGLMVVYHGTKEKKITRQTNPRECISQTFPSVCSNSAMSFDLFCRPPTSLACEKNLLFVYAELRCVPWAKTNWNLAIWCVLCLQRVNLSQGLLADHCCCCCCCCCCGCIRQFLSSFGG